jgi:hypothetical protein
MFLLNVEHSNQEDELLLAATPLTTLLDDCLRELAAEVDVG